jgi:hypothetical protein
MSKTDDPEEENKQRQFKSVLNKLTPDNFDRLSQQLLDVGINEAKTLIGLIAQVGEGTGGQEAVGAGGGHRGPLSAVGVQLSVTRCLMECV